MDVHLGERFDLDRAPHRLLEGVGEDDEAMVPEQAGRPVLQGRERDVREFLRAKAGVRGAADVDAAGHGHHVVERGNGALMHGHGGAVDRMRVEHHVHIVPGLQDVAVKAPFGGGAMAARIGRVPSHFHDVVGSMRS